VAVALPIALAALGIAGGLVLAAGVIWCFFYPTAQNKIGLEYGKWKASGLPTGAILVVCGAGLLYLDSQNEPEAKPHLAEYILTTADGQQSVQANVRCPFTVNLTGRISVTSGKGNVAYRFVRQGFNEPETHTATQHFQVDGPGSHTVHDSYTFNVPEGDLYVEDRLEVLEPENRRSEPVALRVRCDATLPQGPTEPPPDVSPPGAQQTP
jgi:hypothetical protein